MARQTIGILNRALVESIDSHYAKINLMINHLLSMRIDWLKDIYVFGIVDQVNGYGRISQNNRGITTPIISSHPVENFLT